MSNTTPAIYHNGHFYGNEVGNMTLMDNKLNKLSDNIAPKQDSDTASKLIDVGEYFINKDGYLCQCDIQIANQGAITVGTNCHVIPNGLANDLGGGGFSSIDDLTVTTYSLSGGSTKNVAIDPNTNVWAIIVSAIVTTSTIAVSVTFTIDGQTVSYRNYSGHQGDPPSVLVPPFNSGANGITVTCGVSGGGATIYVITA